mmetsp:Transcript_43489/g.94733  ORF Transcript_43489/g.94733 Transcript_43489/m.94733 type:complete len:349 (+) Transcript_43489:109-1155(+)|eukprot:CAMPEP_0204271732 /NCGR_PEP_ID=MMETSP0468-20130131/20929_1 /ASSEMBLY_ACC=CAM_ASM_000383 /TAXON_ID=2969 /ORGANISM="Oxyrrhis marina" /LENGTH=348 /DNA_ID=CAMNT_0051247479 /DNA_START=102 /DNA_END=1148 /DNA_ORIENTATION=+
MPSTAEIMMTLLAVADGASFLRSNVTANTSNPNGLTFPGYYDSVASGRGIWKWNNALWAYERHLARYKNTPVALAEVGVQSGGSILMWETVLGPQCHMYGLDIAPATQKFQDSRTTITIGDQGDPAMWHNFFSTVTPALDVLIDDGGHTGPQMCTTTAEVWPHIKAGGILAIEDIHGAKYLHEFFLNAAQFYGHRTEQVSAIHIYPYLLMAQKAGVPAAVYDPTAVPGAVVSKQISTIPEITDAVASGQPGTLIVLSNPSWGNMMNPAGLSYVFQTFNDMHDPPAWHCIPDGCCNTAASVCTSRTSNSPQQQKIWGVHVLPSKVVIELAPSVPVIEAVRHGDVWLNYA